MAKPRGGLGKGLDALFVDNTTGSAQTPTALSINDIEPNRSQPRKLFQKAPLEELAESIRQHGVLQPLVVRPMLSGTYQIVAGERRWRAARMAGLSEVPVVVRELTEEQTLEWALVENLQRENLNPMEEALGYAYLMEQFSFTQEQVAKRVGKSRPVIANSLRLLQLPEDVQEKVKDGTLSAGHGRSLLALEDKTLIQEVAKEIQEKGLSVRQIEQMAKSRKRQQDEAQSPGSTENKDGAMGLLANSSCNIDTDTDTDKSQANGSATARKSGYREYMGQDSTLPNKSEKTISADHVFDEKNSTLKRMRDQDLWDNPLLAEAKHSLQESLHRPISIEGTMNHGRLCITFYGEDDLMDLFSSFSEI